MRTTQRKGDLAVAKAIVDFTEQGWDVSIPMTESAAYDLIVDIGDCLKRVQVKYCRTLEVDLRNISSNSQGYRVKKRIEGSYDWLYVYSPESGTYLIRSFNGQRSSLTLKDEYRFPSSG